MFYSCYNTSSEIGTKNNTECQVFINRAQGVYSAAIRYKQEDYDFDSAEYRALKFIYDNNSHYDSIHIVLFSNFLLKNVSIKRVKTDQKPTNLEVWDLMRLYKLSHSMSDRAAIDIDFSEENYQNYKIPYIMMESPQFGYQCIQAMLLTRLLYDLYEKYKTNLLYNNVRYFLGLKGGSDKKPNTAMLETLREENEKFLAFNNGITALANSVDVSPLGEKTDISDKDEKGSTESYITMGILKKINDFRIINGGQTTAVIFNGKKLNDGRKKEGQSLVNLRGVYVQMKLIVSDKIDSFATKIAKTSNFQNVVKTSEFTISDQFNKELENLSRKVPVTKVNEGYAYWFFERLRGQYDESLKSSSDKMLFESRFPKSYKFPKEEIAKVWLSWEQRPHDAVKGACSAYGSFIKDKTGGRVVPDENFYKDSIGLLVIYKYLLNRPEKKEFGNGNATIAAYTLAATRHLVFDLDLHKIAYEGIVADELKCFFNNVSNQIFKILSKRISENTQYTILSFGKTIAAYTLVTGNLAVSVNGIENYRKRL